MRTSQIVAAVLVALVAGCAGQGGDSTEASPPAEPSPQAETSVEAVVTPPAQGSAPAAPPKAPPTHRPTHAPIREVAAPVGTELRLELVTSLSTATAQVEAPVTARLLESVTVEGLTILPAGATLHGSVIDVDRAGRVRGRSHLSFRFTEVAAGDVRSRIRTRELVFEGEASVREDATKVGAGAGLGAVIGGIVGGGSGAAKGAAIGGAAGAGAVLATRGREVELPAGSVVTAALAAPYTVRVN